MAVRPLTILALQWSSERELASWLQTGLFQTAGGHWLNSSMEVGEIGVSADRLHCEVCRDAAQVRSLHSHILWGGSSDGQSA